MSSKSKQQKQPRGGRWRESVQDRVSTQILPVAQRVGAVSEVLLDSKNKTLRVVVHQSTPSSVSQAIRKAVIATPIGQSLHNHAWSFLVDHEHQRPYISHVKWSLVPRLPSRLRGLGGNVCVVILAHEEIVALRRALQVLENTVLNARVVATFAMGGLPLLHWLTSPKSGSVTAADQSLANASSYHLLPGLNWSGTPREKDVFKAWISKELSSSGKILVFDTGREGNGIRQARELAQDAIMSCAPACGASVAILGLIDGPERRSELQQIRGMNGITVPLTVDYARVPHLPTEDNGLLLGFDADRQTGTLHPVEGLVLYRIEKTPAVISCAVCAVSRLGSRIAPLRNMVIQAGRHFVRQVFVASSSGGNTISDFVRGRHDSLGGLRSHTEDVAWATAAMLLARAQASEIEALDNVLAVNLVDSSVRNDAVTRHQEECRQLLTRHWSREEKRVVVLGV